jgi:DNA modification methylase
MTVADLLSMALTGPPALPVVAAPWLIVVGGLSALGAAIHPARYPRAFPEFFIKMLTEEGDVVVDPFAGSNTTGATAESLQRRWIAFESVEEYLRGSKFRFEA